MAGMKPERNLNLNAFYEKILIAILLFTGFATLFIWMKKMRIVSRIMTDTKENLREAAEKRESISRKKLGNYDTDSSVWKRLDKNLCYSGIKSKYPFITAEVFLTMNICMAALLAVFFLAYGGVAAAVAAVAVFMISEVLALRIARMRMNNRVNENLMKFLDFLGNYSITSGELTAVLGQIGKYMDEPLKNVLEECCYEAQTTGDTGTALLAMAEKIEHPQFKELVRNMEINIRYCADFSVLVSGSRRSMRDYMRTSQERKGMLREAGINMALLLIMSVFSLLIVDGMIDDSIWHILFYSMPGHVALIITVLVIGLFAGQIMKSN
jgi:Flp pilus assembly protein TadB